MEPGADKPTQYHRVLPAPGKIRSSSRVGSSDSSLWCGETNMRTTAGMEADLIRQVNDKLFTADTGTNCQREAACEDLAAGVRKTPMHTFIDSVTLAKEEMTSTDTKDHSEDSSDEVLPLAA